LSHHQASLFLIFYHGFNPSIYQFNENRENTMKKLLKLSFALCFAGLSMHTMAVEVSPSVMADYQAGLQGDGDANARANESLASLLTQDANNAVIKSLLGSSKTTSARYTKKPWQKMQLAEKGMDLLDESLELAEKTAATDPATSLQVNTTAGCTFVNVPKMFNRFDQGYYLLKQTIASKAFAYMPPRQQVSTYLCALQAASTAKDKEKTQQFAQAIEAIAPQGPHMARVEQLTNDMGE
jgi:hypothetical protein